VCPTRHCCRGLLSVPPICSNADSSRICWANADLGRVVRVGCTYWPPCLHSQMIALRNMSASSSVEERFNLCELAVSIYRLQCKQLTLISPLSSAVYELVLMPMLMLAVPAF
jgi:hypothetical protein